MKTKWIILAVAVVVVALSAGYGLMAPAQPVETATAIRGPLREYIDERGKTRLPRTYVITTPFAGWVEHIDLQEGDAVAEGEVVANMSREDLEDDVAQSQAVVERLDASIAETIDASVEGTALEQAELFVKSMADLLAAADARKTSGQKRMDYSEGAYARIARLTQSGVQTEDELEIADLRRVESQVDYQQDILNWQTMVSIDAATKLLPRVIQQFIGRKTLTAAVLKKERTEAEARLRQAVTRRERGAMQSPVDGIVLTRLIDNQQFLASGESLLEIGRIEDLEVEADILSQDVVRVSLGDEVEFHGAAIGRAAGEGLRGKVERIYPAGFTKVSSLGVEQQRVKVIAKPDEGSIQQWRSLQIGVSFRVQIRIFTDQRQDAILIPRSALFRGADGGWRVFTVRGRRARLTGIEVGILNDQVVEVTSGLSEGDEVVLAPESSLTEGARVQPLSRQ